MDRLSNPFVFADHERLVVDLIEIQIQQGTGGLQLVTAATHIVCELNSPASGRLRAAKMADVMPAKCGSTQVQATVYDINKKVGKETVTGSKNQRNRPSSH